MTNQCTCGFPDTGGMTHRLGEPCLIVDGAAMLDRSAVVVPLGLTPPTDLRGDPQEADPTQDGIVQRGAEMARGYETRIANLGKVVHNLSVSRDKLIALRAAVDQSISEVEALVSVVSDEREAKNYTLIAQWLRQAADAASD